VRSKRPCRGLESSICRRYRWRGRRSRILELPSDQGGFRFIVTVISNHRMNTSSSR